MDCDRDEGAISVSGRCSEEREERGTRADGPGSETSERSSLHQLQQLEGGRERERGAVEGRTHHLVTTALLSDPSIGFFRETTAASGGKEGESSSGYRILDCDSSLLAASSCCSGRSLEKRRISSGYSILIGYPSCTGLARRANEGEEAEATVIADEWTVLTPSVRQRTSAGSAFFFSQFTIASSSRPPAPFEGDPTPRCYHTPGRGGRGRREEGASSEREIRLLDTTVPLCLMGEAERGGRRGRGSLACGNLLFHFSPLPSSLVVVVVLVSDVVPSLRQETRAATSDKLASRLQPHHWLLAFIPLTRAKHPS